MKKHPSDGAYDRSRASRREMTEAERRIWLMRPARQIVVFDGNMIPLVEQNRAQPLSRTPGLQDAAILEQ
jgi:hypothetical protein